MLVTIPRLLLLVLPVAIIAQDDISKPTWPILKYTFPRPGNGSEWASLGATPELAMQRLVAEYTQNTLARLRRENGECNASTLVRRKEWGDMSPEERLSFISAAKCLSTLPARTTSDIAPGARSRWDDFVVGHILQTVQVHFSAWLLPWHRHLIWELEQALRNECNYSAGLPYWDWSKSIEGGGLDNDPLFDGSATSLSGNGTFTNATCGYVDSGPLAANWTVNLGPVHAFTPLCRANPRMDGLAYNGRPLERDMTAHNYAIFANTNAYANVTEIILSYQNASSLNLRVDSGDGIHGPPHLAVGGVMSDTYASPGDPAFFLHHANLDRVWSVWQSRDFQARENDIGYTSAFDAGLRSTAFNWPPTPFVTLNSTLYISPFFENTTAKDAMSPIAGKYCYIYV